MIMESGSKNELADFFFLMGSALNIVPQLRVCFNATEGLSQTPIASLVECILAIKSLRLSLCSSWLQMKLSILTQTNE